MAVNHSNVTVSPPRKNFKYLEKGCPVIPKIVVKIGFVPPKSENFYIDNISCANCHQKKSPGTHFVYHVWCGTFNFCLKTFIVPI